MQVIDSQATSADAPHTSAVLCDKPPKRLQTMVHEAIAVRHYSRRTEQASKQTLTLWGLSKFRQVV